eukprot:gene12648-16957_t
MELQKRPESFTLSRANSVVNPIPNTYEAYRVTNKNVLEIIKSRFSSRKHLDPAGFLFVIKEEIYAFLTSLSLSDEFHFSYLSCKKNSKDRFKFRMLHEQSRTDLYRILLLQNEELIKRYIKANPHCVQADHPLRYDPVGANIIHLAYLFQNFELGQSLVKEYGSLAIQPYAGQPESIPRDIKKDFRDKFDMLYDGENILHMVIIFRKKEQVQFLLEHFYKNDKNGLKTLLTQEVNGQCFQQDGEFYYGGFPLHFAACTNDTEIFDLVLKYTTMIYDIDDLPPKKRSHPSLLSTISEDINSISIDEKDNEEPPPIQRFDAKRFVDGTEILKNEQITTAHDYNLLLSDIDQPNQEPIHNAGFNAIFMRDSYGNTLAHICVHHALKEMYDHIFATSMSIVKDELTRHYDNPANKLHNRPLPNSFEYRHMTVGLHPTETQLSYKNGQIEEDARMIVGARLLNVLNAQYHSPLTLAAAQFNPRKVQDSVLLERHKDMLEYLISCLKTHLWNFGSIKYSVINCNGLDANYALEGYSLYTDVVQAPDVAPANATPKPLKNADKKCIEIASQMHSVIQWICINGSHSAMKETPDIRRIIEKKWETCGYPELILNYYFDVITTVIITFYSIYSNGFTGAGTRPTGAILLSIILFIIYGFKVLFDFFFLIIYRSSVWISFKNTRGAASLDRICKIIKSYSIFLALIFQAVGIQTPNGHLRFKFCLVTAILVSWLHMLYYLMFFEQFSSFVLCVYKIIGKDVRNFSLYFILIVTAFAVALTSLSDNQTETSQAITENNYVTNDKSGNRGIYAIILAGYTLIQIVANIDPTYDHIHSWLTKSPSNLTWLSDIIFTFFSLSVVILMINILIAMLTRTFQAFSEKSSEIILMEKSNVMDSIESDYLLFCPSALKLYRKKYCEDKNDVEDCQNNNVTNGNSQNNGQIQPQPADATNVNQNVTNGPEDSQVDDSIIPTINNQNTVHGPSQDGVQPPSTAAPAPNQAAVSRVPYYVMFLYEYDSAWGSGGIHNIPTRTLTERRNSISHFPNIADRRESIHDKE